MRSAYDLEVDTGIDWLTRARCRDYPPEWWTAANGGDFAGQRANGRARAICRTCTVTEECMERADRLGAHGMIIAGETWSAPADRPQGWSLRCARRDCRAIFTTVKAKRRFCSARCKNIEYLRGRHRA